MPDYYRVLNLTPVADEEEIKKALNREMRLWSNRTNAPQIERREEAVRMVKLLEDAEGVLLDARKRRQYDCQTKGEQATIDAPNRLIETGALALVEMNCANPQSFGVVANNKDGHQYNLIVLRKDVPLPAEANVIFATTVENQAQIRVRLTEGEEEDLAYVKIIGELRSPIPPYPNGSLIKITFKYDLDGIFHAEVLDLTAKKSLGNMRIERRANCGDARPPRKD